MTGQDSDKSRIRDAATVILMRRDGDVPRILMGQRGAAAAFMPSKFVFPGGAMDAADRAFAAGWPLDPDSAARLALHSDPDLAEALVLAGIRETFEETGLALGVPGVVAGTVPESWRRFAALGLRPATEALRFVFRAITPPGRPRRFDARFFLADAGAIAGDPDDLSRASGELSHLTWIGLDEARGLEMPFITEVVLAEIAEILRMGADGRPVPFFRHLEKRSEFISL
ncbi:MAG: NUDIX hydrolase [Alphaproteobacteria bacterium]|nr:MAG: NUDIX hydrolase [Alphaproteobacteria bacterium]